MSALTEKLYEHVRVYAKAEQEAVALRAKADSIENHAYLHATGTIPERERYAEIEAEEAEVQARAAEAYVRGLKAKIRAIETDIDVHRTYGATVRAELATLGYQESA